MEPVKERSQKQQVAVRIGLAVAALTLLIPFVLRPTEPSFREGNHYVRHVIFVDATPAASRMHIYRFNVTPKLASGPHRFDAEIASEEVKPGLTHYDTSAKDAAKSLRPLLEAAELHVPRDSWGCTPVVVYIDDSLSRIDTKFSADVLKSVRKEIKSSRFNLFEDNHVAIANTTERAMYGWMTANYMLGRWPLEEPAKGKPLKAAAVLEVGGDVLRATSLPVEGFDASLLNEEKDSRAAMSSRRSQSTFSNLLHRGKERGADEEEGGEGWRDSLRSVRSKLHNMKDRLHEKASDAFDDVSDAAEDRAERTKDLKDSAVDKAKDLKDAAAEKVAGLTEGVTDTAEDAAKMAKDVKDAAATRAADLKDNAAAKARELKDSAADLKDSAAEGASGLKDEAISRAQVMKDEAVERASALKDAAANKFEGLNEKAEDKAGSLKDAAHEKVESLKETAADAAEATSGAAADAKDAAAEGGSRLKRGVKKVLNKVFGRGKKESESTSSSSSASDSASKSKSESGSNSRSGSSSSSSTSETGEDEEVQGHGGNFHRHDGDGARTREAEFFRHAMYDNASSNATIREFMERKKQRARENDIAVGAGDEGRGLGDDLSAAFAATRQRLQAKKEQAKASLVEEKEAVFDAGEQFGETVAETVSDVAAKGRTVKDKLRGVVDDAVAKSREELKEATARDVGRGETHTAREGAHFHHDIANDSEHEQSSRVDGAATSLNAAAGRVAEVAEDKFGEAKRLAEEAKENLQDAKEKLSKKAQSAGEAAADKASDAAEAVQAGAEDVVESGRSFASKAAGWVKKGASNLAHAGAESTHHAVDAAKEAAASALHKSKDAAKEGGKVAVDTLGSAASAAAGAAINATAGGKDALRRNSDVDVAGDLLQHHVGELDDTPLEMHSVESSTRKTPLKVAVHRSERIGFGLREARRRVLTMGSGSWKTAAEGGEHDATLPDAHKKGSDSYTTNRVRPDLAFHEVQEHKKDEATAKAGYPCHTFQDCLAAARAVLHATDVDCGHGGRANTEHVHAKHLKMALSEAEAVVVDGLYEHLAPWLEAPHMADPLIIGSADVSDESAKGIRNVARRARGALASALSRASSGMRVSADEMMYEERTTSRHVNTHTGSEFELDSHWVHDELPTVTLKKIKHVAESLVCPNDPYIFASHLEGGNAQHCFDLAYIYALLRDGYGLDDSADIVLLKDTHHGRDTWGAGAMLKLSEDIGEKRMWRC